jgi:hypothetical protein
VAVATLGLLLPKGIPSYLVDELQGFLGGAQAQAVGGSG